MRRYTFTRDGQQFLITVHADGAVEVATREHPGETWGPPAFLEPLPVGGVRVPRQRRGAES